MSIPGVGPITSLAFRVTVDDPSRFDSSKAVGAHLGLTPRVYQSGETDRSGQISKAGDHMLRHRLYEAASALMTRCRQPSRLRAWGIAIARRRGAKRARVAVARKQSDTPPANAHVRSRAVRLDGRPLESHPGAVATPDPEPKRDPGVWSLGRFDGTLPLHVQPEISPRPASGLRRAPGRQDRAAPPPAVAYGQS